MKLSEAFTRTLRSRRFWFWQIGGAVIYAIPAVIRYATRDVVIPLFNFPGIWIWHVIFIPGNLLEKVLVNAFFPGGAGSVAGEVFASIRKGEVVTGKAKYLARLGGAMGQTAVWSAFQFFGYFLLIPGPHGSGNLFESIHVFPINFVLASLSIFTPDVVYFAKSRMENVLKKFSKRLPEDSQLKLNEIGR